MVLSGAYRIWLGRLCLAVTAVLALAGLYYGNIRFLPVAAGFGILTGLSYTRRPFEPTESLSRSGSRRAL